MLHLLLAAASTAAAAIDSADTYPHPALAPPSLWPGAILIIIVVGLFATAAIVGPIVRVNMQETLDFLKPGARD